MTDYTELLEILDEEARQGDGAMASAARAIRSLLAAQPQAAVREVAWLCVDDRYPYVKGIVTTSHDTLGAWTHGGIKYVGLAPLPHPPAERNTEAG